MNAMTMKGEALPNGAGFRCAGCGITVFANSDNCDNPQVPLRLCTSCFLAAAPTAAAAQTMPTEFQGKWCAVGDERSNQLLLPQARMSIPARDDMVVPGGLAAATIACVISMAAQGRWIAVG